MGVSTNYSAWFGGGTNASAAVLTPAQVAAVAPLVRVTAAYVVMYYAFCFFQSWSKLYLSASRRPSLFLVRRLVLLRLVDAWWRRSPPFGERRGDGVPSSASRDRDCYATTSSRAPHTPSTRLTSAIAQEADSPAERRRQETDAHAAEVRQLWVQ